MKLYFLLALMAADFKVIAPPGPAPVGPYSPGLLTGDFLYVSGQGARNAEGKFAAGTEQQTADTLDNVRRIVEAAGLTMEHVVYTQLYLTDISRAAEADSAWRKAFPKNPPARAALGVSRLPTDTPVEISAVAIRDLAKKRVVIAAGFDGAGPFSPGVLAGDRLFVSGMAGEGADAEAQVRSALDRMKSVLEAAGLGFGHMAFVNPYLTDGMPMDVMNRVYAGHFEFGNTPARATIRVASLPRGANIVFTGVAARDLSQRRAVRPKNMEPSPTASPCVFVADTFYCSAKSGFIPGPQSGIYAETVESQVRQTMRNLLDGLEEAGLKFDNVVASNVYLDNLDDFSKMNGIYARFFPVSKPTRTTVQPVAPLASRAADDRGRYPKLEEISLIAVK